MKKFFSLLIIATLLLTLIPTTPVQAAVALSDTNIKLYEGDTLQLTLNDTDKTVIWNTTNKKIASVTSDGIVKAISEGKAKITARIDKKKYVCKVTVSKNISTIKPIDAYNYMARDIWTPFSVLDNYTRFGESSFGDDFDTTLDTLKKNIVEMSKYNDVVNAFDGEEYDDFKLAWTNLYNEFTTIYNGFGDNPPSIGHKSNWIDLDTIQKLLNKLSEECMYFE